MDRVWKANVHMSPSCPRCGSSNTKFCYYNNYSLAQPRYFCKGCRRYWTKGGSLRNVPVGGGCRKIRRCRSIRVSTAGAASRVSSANCFGSNGGLPASTEGSHIDLALVYANYLSHTSESKGELETEGTRGGSDDQFMLNMKQVEPDIEFLSGNDLIRCEFLSNFFAETQFNNENQISHEDFGLTDTNNYPSPPLPNEEMASWWLDSRTEMTTAMNHVGFPESDFGSIGLDPSFTIANLGDFDLPL